MANPRQRRKAKSGATMKPSNNAKKQMKKKLVRAPTVHGPDVLKDNYDPKLTLKQNYARLGLIGSLGVRPDTGGVERPAGAAVGVEKEQSASSSAEEAPLRKGMAKIVRDEDGNIVDIIEAAAEDDEESTPWGGKMKESIADSEDVETFMPPTSSAQKVNPVVGKLEEMAAQAVPVERHTSQLEAQWLYDLVSKYGEDTEAMAKDRKLNVWQKTEGEIRRAIKKAGGFAAFQ